MSPCLERTEPLFQLTPAPILSRKKYACALLGRFQQHFTTCLDCASTVTGYVHTTLCTSTMLCTATQEQNENYIRVSPCVIATDRFMLSSFVTC